MKGQKTSSLALETFGLLPAAPTIAPALLDAKRCMRREDIPAGERIFVDGNILIYHFSGISPESRAFLQRCERKQVEAVTGTHILLEVTHRLMVLEALHKDLISGGQQHVG